MATPIPPKKDKLPVRLIPKEVISLSVLIIFTTGIIVWCFASVYQKIESFKFQETVNWENRYAYDLETIPTWFWYQEEKQQLLAIKQIDEEAKVNLLNLYAADSLGYAAYKGAIDELAFKTNQSTSSPSYLWTLLLGSLAAMIGVQLRTVYRFVDRACYKQNLDAIVWWPWYVFRPLEAFILGALVILLAQVNLLNIEVGDASNLFWIGLAALAGFGAPDVINRLRMVSKTLFGVSD